MQSERKDRIMTAAQYDAMNVQLWQNIGAIAEDKSLMKRLAKYVAKLRKEKEDPSLMTKEEYFAMLDEREAAYARGEYSELLPGENLTEHLRRLGYDI